MTSNIIKRILGIIISIILLSSSILLISIIAINKVIAPDNIKEIVSNININDVVTANDSKLYKQITDIASKNGISKEQVDQILASEASSLVVNQYVSDITTALLNGNDLNLILGSSLERAIDNNTDELAAVLSDNKEDIAVAQKKIEEIKPELVKSVRQNNEINSILSGKSDNNQLSRLSNAITLYSKFAILAKDIVKLIAIVLVAISILLLFIISFSKRSFGLWYGINGTIISLISCAVFYSLIKITDYFSRTLSSRNEFLINILDIAVSPVISVFKLSAYITAWIAVIGFIIHFILRRLLNNDCD